MASVITLVNWISIDAQAYLELDKFMEMMFLTCEIGTYI